MLLPSPFLGGCRCIGAGYYCSLEAATGDGHSVRRTGRIVYRLEVANRIESRKTTWAFLWLAVDYFESEKQEAKNHPHPERDAALALAGLLAVFRRLVVLGWGWRRDGGAYGFAAVRAESQIGRAHV